jgi:hypothetical protein
MTYTDGVEQWLEIIMENLDERLASKFYQGSMCLNLRRSVIDRLLYSGSLAGRADHPCWTRRRHAGQVVTEPYNLRS